MPFSDYSDKTAMRYVVPLGFCVEIRTSSVSVGTTAKPLPAVPLGGRRSVVVVNTSSVTVYLGGSDVTTGNGIPLGANESFSADFGTVALYAVAESGSDNDIRVLEVS